ncbi:hypothetical protein [Burkholderia phage FLC9]|nr:hypothetical protein [Burkholderia phage FLC9]
MSKITHDPTHNFFMLQDIYLPNYRELTEMVHQATTIDGEANDSFVLRIMKRVNDAAYSLLQLTNGCDGKDDGKLRYHWLPVKLYMAVAKENGDYDYYDGFKIGISCSGVTNTIEIFFVLRASGYKYGVFERHQLGGWQMRMRPVEEPTKLELQVEATMPEYTVWNATRSEGFVTHDKQLAYETRKCATTNLSDEMGNPSSVAREFCERWGDDTLVIETREVSARLTKLSDEGLEKLFQYYSNACERGRFRLVRNRLSDHPTVHAVKLLNELAACDGDNGPMLVEPHPKLQGVLRYDVEKFKRNADRDQVLDLVRCNVRFDAESKVFDLGEGNK